MTDPLRHMGQRSCRERQDSLPRCQSKPKQRVVNIMKTLATQHNMLFLFICTYAMEQLHEAGSPKAKMDTAEHHQRSDQVRLACRVLYWIVRGVLEAVLTAITCTRARARPPVRLYL